MKFIPGIEFSTDFDGKEIHIIGYGIDYNNKELKKIINEQNTRRVIRFKKVIQKLNSLGFKIDISELDDLFSESKAPGRMHIAEMLKRKKYVKSIGEAFNKYIGDACIANVKKENYSTAEIIKLIKKINGIAVIAHPEKNSLKGKLSEVIQLGVEGIEIVHPSHNKKTIEFYDKFADTYALIKTGGSDFHGNSNFELKNLGKYVINLNTNFFEKYFLN